MTFAPPMTLPETSRFAVAFLLAALLPAAPCMAQSAPEHHLWQEARSFAPASTTARAITGAITLSGLAGFATPGSEMSVTFGNGTSARLTSEGASWRAWGFGSETMRTAEVFRLDADPGPLLNGNTLCGGPADAPLRIVFHDDRASAPPGLGMLVFRAPEPPQDASSPGLCATFSFVAEPVSASAPPGTPPQTSTPVSGTEGPASGKWRLSTSQNPLDDSTTVILALTAESGSSTFGDPVTLIARCKSDKTEAFVNWGNYLGNDSGSVYSDWKRVTVRIGSGKARSERWGISTDHKATFVPNWAGTFLKSLLDQDRLVLQTIPYGENPATAVFDISGLRGVLGRLSSACNWSF